MKVTDIEAEKYLKDKFKNVSALSFTTYGNELVINFSGFEDQDDLKEFADFVFSRRLGFKKNDTKGGLMAFAWFIYDMSYDGLPTIDWI